MSSAQVNAFDLIVIGGGEGAAAAAWHAAASGLRTALVAPEAAVAGAGEQDDGPVLRALQSAAGRDVGSSGQSSLAARWPGVCRLATDCLLARREREQAQLRLAGVAIVAGAARLDGPGRVVCGAEGAATCLMAPRIVLATGSRAAGLPGVEFDGGRVLAVGHLPLLASLPKSVLVVGAGAVGLEAAALLLSCGVATTIAEREDSILPGEDAECTEALAALLTRQGAVVHCATRVRDVAVGPDRISCVLDDRSCGRRSEVTPDSLLVAVGRRPRTTDLGLETVAVVLDRRGHLHVDSSMQTTEPGLYAIGDIVPTRHLPHVARREAIVAVDHAAGREVRPVRYQQAPFAVRTVPGLASVGLTAAAARTAGHAVRCGRHPFADERRPGFVKVVADAETGRLLGVHMFGAGTDELITAAAGALACGGSLANWVAMMALPDTLGEALAGAVAAAAGCPLPGGTCE